MKCITEFRHVSIEMKPQLMSTNPKSWQGMYDLAKEYQIDLYDSDLNLVGCLNRHKTDDGFDYLWKGKTIPFPKDSWSMVLQEDSIRYWCIADLIYLEY